MPVTQSTKAAAPAGKVASFAQAVAPAGWLACNGAAVSRATYAALFAAIGTTYGVGDGATTFNLPELRGEFLRGLDAGRGVDAGRVIGSYQAGQMPYHTHSISSSPSGGNDGFEGAANSGASQSGGAGGNENGAENRPRNVAVLYCIKT